MSELVTLDNAFDTMLELYDGNEEPSLLQALWNAALSKHMPFESNVAYARALRPFVDTGLPAYDDLYELLRQARRDNGGPAYGLTGGHVQTLYEIEKAYPWIATLPIGDTLAEQRSWRHEVARVWGVGYKVASWALQIYDMQSAHVMAVDTIHCQRLDLDARELRKTEAGFRFYNEIEEYLRWECEPYASYPVASVAAWFWFTQRGGIVAHEGLSCRKRV